MFNLTCSMKFLSPELRLLNICVSLAIRPSMEYCMSGLEILAATGICQINNENGYVDC